MFFFPLFLFFLYKRRSKRQKLFRRSLASSKNKYGALAHPPRFTYFLTASLSYFIAFPIFCHLISFPCHSFRRQRSILHSTFVYSSLCCIKKKNCCNIMYSVDASLLSFSHVCLSSSIPPLLLAIRCWLLAPPPRCRFHTFSVSFFGILRFVLPRENQRLLL